MKTVENLPGMIGRHSSMLAVYRLTRSVAPSPLPILVVGETGTGKELVARAIHELSACATGPLVDINCAALPESLAEAELFGWERGAFTGAVRSGTGLLLEADGGTLFLDEVCSMPVTVQAKLLRALDQKTFRAVGARTQRRADFRIVASVAEDVDTLVRQGRLRSDLAHRLAGVTIALPPLRCRRSDIAGLVAHFWSRACGDGSLPREVVERLARLAWSGNVRELRATVERCALLPGGSAAILDHLPPAHASDVVDDDDLATAVARAGSLRAAARALGIPRTTLRRRLDAMDRTSLLRMER